MTQHVKTLSLREQLLAVAQKFADAHGHKSLKRASTLVFRDWKTFDRLKNGKDITTGNFEKAIRWFSDNWPDGTVWPEGVTRPAARPASPEAA